MSDTPETDRAERMALDMEYMVPIEFARRLERELAEARDTLTTIHRWVDRNHPDGFIDSQTYAQNLERVADRWYERLDGIERERDEARERERVAIASWDEERIRALREGERVIEAMEQNDKLRDIAERAIGSLKWYWQDYAKLRAELDQLKEGAK